MHPGGRGSLYNGHANLHDHKDAPRRPGEFDKWSKGPLVYSIGKLPIKIY
jgi:hypothetical protein